MPIFRFKCEQCEHEKEVLCNFRSQESIECKYCKGFRMTKQIGTPTFRLKGRGFYINDYPKGK